MSLVTRLVMLALFDAIFSEKTAQEATCTKFEGRVMYTNCVLDYTVMELWCDQTNLTKIPAPHGIESYAPPNRSRKLFVNDSCITAIGRGDLNEYTVLESFDCSHNLLTSLSEPLFENTASYLLDIHFGFNAIETISTKAFSGMKKVEVLDLAHNQIKALSDGTFRHLPNLKELYLNHNNLRHLPKHVFHGLAKLETLTMQSNLLNKWMLQMNIFPNLKYLRLDGNRIRKIRKNDFIGMSSLLNISLINNGLRTIEKGAFNWTRALQHIDLRNNSLVHLPKHLFSLLCNLRVLHLSRNHLVTPHPQWFFTVLTNAIQDSNEIESSSSDNAWRCDSEAAEHWMFLRWADDEHSNLLKLFDVNCASPQHLAGLSMTNISREDLQAERKQGKTDVRIESKLETRLTNWNRRASVAKVSRKSYKIFMNAARGCSEQTQVVKKTFLHQPRRLLLKKSVKEEVTNSFESGSGSARSECSSAFGQFGVLCFSVFMTNSYF